MAKTSPSTATRQPTLPSTPAPATTLAGKVTELVHACFTGLYIESHEPEEAIRDLTQLARRESWRLGIWDCDSGLAFPCAEVPVPVNPSDLSDPLAVLRSAGQLSQGSETTLLTFQNFHRFLGSTEVLQAVQKQVSVGKHTRTFIVILAPVVNLPPEIEKQFMVIEHELPGRAQLPEIATGIAQADELPADDDLARVLDSAAGLTRYEAEGAFSLSMERRCLPLSGLQSLDAEVAAILAAHRGPLLLNGLTRLPDEVAQQLTRHGGPLQLDGLGTMSVETATILAQQAGGWLSLGGLTALTGEAAKALAGHSGPLVLNGLTTLSDAAAGALTQPKRSLSFSGVTTLSAETAGALARHKGRLYLDGLTWLSDEAAQALAQHRGRLSLRGLTTLSAETAGAFAAARNWEGNLPKLTSLDSPDSVAIAQALASRKGPLKLPSLKKITPKTLTTLIEKRDVEIPLIETLELIPEPDGSATEDFVIPEWLEERQRQQRGRASGRVDADQS